MRTRRPLDFDGVVPARARETTPLSPTASLRAALSAATTAPLAVLLATAPWAGPACAVPGAEADIAPLREISLDRLQPGSPFRIAGAGFVPGPVEVALSGTLAQPGHGAVPVEIVLAGSAVSEAEIVGEVPSGAVEALRASRGVFRGGLVVRFPPTATAGLPALVGRRAGLTVPVVAETPARRETHVALVTAARDLLRRLGLEVRQVESPAGGRPPALAVRSVAPGAPAYAGEIRPGDRIVALDGIGVSGIADLAPDPDARYVTLSLEEGSSGRPFEVHAKLREEDRTPGTPEALAVVIAFATIGLVLTVHFAGVGGGAGRLLAFPIVGRRRRRDAPPRLVPGRPAAGDRPGLAALAIVSVTAAAAPVCVYLYADAIPLAALWAAVAAVVLIHRVGNVVADLVHSNAGILAGFGRAVVGALSAALALLPLTAAAVLCLWDSIAVTVGGAVAAQGAEPLGWTVLRDPFALALVLLAADRLGAAFAPEASPWRTTLDVAVAAAGSLFLAVTCLGGWNAGAAGDRPFAGLPVGAWVLGGKTAALFAAVLWYGRRRAARGANPRAAGLAWLAALPLALASVCLDTFLSPEWIAGLVHPATLGLAATAALGIWIRYRQRAAPAIVELRVEPM